MIINVPVSWNSIWLWRLYPFRKLKNASLTMPEPTNSAPVAAPATNTNPTTAQTSSTGGASPSHAEFLTQKHKHLDYIQDIIKRMAGNSFLLRGWSVALVSGIAAISVKDGKFGLMLVAIIPILAFWILDAYYLWLERLFRKLYKDVAGQTQGIDYLLDIATYKKNKLCLLGCLSWGTVPLFHGCLLAITFFFSLYGPKLAEFLNH